MNRVTSEQPSHSLLRRVAAARAELERLEDELRSSTLVYPQNGIDPVSLARRMYGARRARNSFLPEDLFADPAWDLLLDLYVNHYEGRAVSTSSACMASAVPPTTALRWIDKLEAFGLLVRRPGAGDYRLVHLELTPKARMTDLLVKLGATLPGDVSGKA